MPTFLLKAGKDSQISSVCNRLRYHINGTACKYCQRVDKQRQTGKNYLGNSAVFFVQVLIGTQLGISLQQNLYLARALVKSSPLI